jgi:hypothetical protein
MEGVAHTTPKVEVDCEFCKDKNRYGRRHCWVCKGTGKRMKPVKK